MSEIPEELRVMGDALERAWQKDVGARTLPARRIVIGVVAAVMLLGAGAAIANSVLKSNADEEAGLLGGHNVFEGTSPTCESRSTTAFHCTLDRAPTGLTFYDESLNLRPDAYLGTKVQTVDAQSRIDGGCIAVSKDGRAWDCYLGEAAVTRGIIGPNLLGRHLPAPAHG
jgi:hypothetical protein